jgi:hypothetical protein
LKPAEIATGKLEGCKKILKFMTAEIEDEVYNKKMCGFLKCSLEKSGSPCCKLKQH